MSPWVPVCYALKCLRGNAKQRLGLLLLAALGLPHGSSLALTTDSFLSERPEEGSFCLFAAGKGASIFADSNDWRGVVRVATDLQTDLHRVSGIEPSSVRQTTNLGKNAIIV